MTDSEAVAAVRRGERVAGSYSMHPAAPADVLAMLKICPGFNHDWRVIFCTSETDVVECRRCGTQELCRCDFNEEYA